MDTNPQVSGTAAQEPPTRGGQSVPSIGSPARATDLTSRQLQVALTWLGRGIPVVPCSSTDKAPMVRGFGKDATPEQLAKFSDPDQITEWWSGKYRRAHVGLLTGRSTTPDGRGLVVVDLDAQGPDAVPLTGRWKDCVHGSDVLEVRMREAGGEWPTTYAVKTPSKGKPVPGEHLYFVQPTDGPLIGCATGEGHSAPHLGPLADVRGVGGVIIAAGSYSPKQGRPYERVTPASLGPQPLPDWLLQLLRPPASVQSLTDDKKPTVRQLPTGDRAERYATAVLNRLCDQVAEAGDGERWRTLSGAALRLAELSSTAPRVLNETDVTRALVDAAMAAGMSSEEKAARAVSTAWERKAGRGAGAA